MVCERCWAEAESLRDWGYGDYNIVDAYKKALEHNSCTPEQQAGPGALLCNACQRFTVNALINCCARCGRTPKDRKTPNEKQHHNSAKS
jgi:hypothetical protein